MTAIIATTAVAGWAQSPKLYVVDSWGDSVWRANPDGSAPWEGTVSVGLHPHHLVVDEQRGYFYVTGSGGVMRGNLDSRILTPLFAVGGSWGIALDASSGVLYFSDIGSGQVMQGNIDGTGLAVVPGIPSGSYYSLALDPVAQHLYLGGVGIALINVDGTNFTPIGGGPFVREMALDLTGGQIYWIGGDAGEGKVAKLNLDGSNPTDLITGLHGGFVGLAIDTEGGKLYWNQQEVGAYETIWRADLDGSNREQIMIVGHVEGLALCDNCPRMSPCPQTPAACTPSASLKATFSLTDTALDDKDQIKWKGGGGAEVTQVDLGAPNNTTTYAACIFDSTAGVDALVGSLQIEPNPMWIDNDPKGWSYKEKTGSEDGVVKARLKPGADGKPKAQVVAKGGSIPMPMRFSGTKFFNQDPRVVVQLVTDPINNPTSTCWGSEFTTSLLNDATQFKAKAP